ncbi:MAG: tripartite tricarboxylate transporter substrate binding protein, partial [Alphaproteobacteria bacterium]|nr:tripartite tricarboxylate transporter substrate binding protein [Alphaproteobacteria bacterium]
MRAGDFTVSARKLALAAGLTVSLALCGQALAQGSASGNWPERTTKLIVPFPPGGINDAVARPAADKLKDFLGTVVIENRGGAGGTIGATAAARSDPDGYTILFGSGATHIVGPAITPTKTYDPVKDFKAVAILTVSGLGIAVHPGLRVNSLQELIAYAKQNPGKLSYGSAGVGSATHLGAELFKSLINDPSIAHVPYKGGGPAMGDLVSGQIRLAVLNISGSMIALHNSGRLRIL